MDWTLIDQPFIQTLSGLLAILLSILLFDRVLKGLLKKLITSLSAERDNWLFSFLKDSKLIFWFLSIPYFTLISQGLKWVPNLSVGFVTIIERVITAGLIFIGLMILTNASRVVNEIYSRSEISRIRPIKGYLQGLLIVAYLIGGIVITAILMDKSPSLLLSGIGALTAILLLVFKDTILSLVAGVQLTTNDLVRVGDWIEMPQFNADGDVIEIALHTVKVQNWDKTITVIPAHKFLENSFKNWRGMQNSGGRRIKRSICIDVGSIRFLNAADIEKFSEIKVLRDYLQSKTDEITKYNMAFGDKTVPTNLRRLTNIGTFRAYIAHYLKNNPNIHQNMTFLVRQLAPTAEGVPIEIYVFTNDTRWAYYEAIQADIFDHLLSVMHEFDLAYYQKPSGADLRQAIAGITRPIPPIQLSSNTELSSKQGS